MFCYFVKNKIDELEFSLEGFDGVGERRVMKFYICDWYKRRGSRKILGRISRREGKEEKE